MSKVSASFSSRFANLLAAIVLVGVPFHAFLTVFGASLVGHYTALRLWDDVLLLVLGGICCFWLVRDKAVRHWFLDSLLVRLILAYAALTLLLGFVSWTKGDVTPKALAYGVLINVRFLAWFLAALLTAQRSSWLREHWAKLLLVPAAIVVVFGGLQYTVLPHNFLSHFGYNANTTIAPIETINHNAHYIRVQSTTRGANPLGAYLVIVLAALGAFLLRGRRKAASCVFGAIALLALYASGSRSAWIGAVLALMVLVWFWLPSRHARIRAAYTLGSIVVVLAGLFLGLRHNTSLQNELLHTQEHSKVMVSSNEGHASALKNGVRDVLHQPLGAGPGTAGPASEYNTGHPVRIAEDYYVQIAQETGWLGVVLFLSILVLIALELYRRIHGSGLALIVFASFFGLAFVNVLSHAWADDTLAFTWWGLAGIALAQPLSKGKKW